MKSKTDFKYGEARSEAEHIFAVVRSCIVHYHPTPSIPVKIIIHKIVFGIPCIIKDTHVFLVF
jgi:hypothetical protein